MRSLNWDCAYYYHLTNVPSNDCPENLLGDVLVIAVALYMIDRFFFRFFFNVLILFINIYNSANMYRVTCSSSCLHEEDSKNITKQNKQFIHLLWHQSVVGYRNNNGRDYQENNGVFSFYGCSLSIILYLAKDEALKVGQEQKSLSNKFYKQMA